MLFQCSLLQLLPLISLAWSLPTDNARNTLSRRNGTDSGVYFGVTSAEHEERNKALKAEGYRVVSLSIFGTPPDVKYAAVWTKAEGTEFETISTADEDAFNSWYDSWKSKGYVSTHVAATGPTDSAVFAGVMEQANITEVQKCGMETPYAYANVTMGLNMIVKGVSVYGSPSNRRYCIVGHENNGNRQQSTYYQTDTVIFDYQKTYNAEIQKRFWRPTYLDVTNDHLISSLFEDSSVGKWESKVGLTESQLSAEIKTQTTNGLSLVHLQGGGNGDDVIYTAIFAENPTPLPRNWNANGNITGFENNDAVTSALDDVMRNWMEVNGMRQAQVAIAREGKLLGERAFTLAETDRAIVQPNDKFLLASVSKMFTHAATQRLIDDGLLNLTTQVYPLLGYKPYDERANNITVDHLVHHTAGYDRSVSGDIGFMFREVARSKNSSTPATLRDMIEYMVDRPLDFTPGDGGYAYSNYGTMLLSYIVTNLTGIPYTDFLKQRVLEDGLEAELFATAAEEHVNDPIVQESKFTGFSPFFPQEEVLVPNVSGGEGDIKEEAVGSFALRASASTIARFIGKNAVWTIGGRDWMYSRDGSVSGARTYAWSAGLENFDWAITLNSREYSSEEEWSNLIYTLIPDIWSANKIVEA
ncbi:beta-lactamase/transpeptidase-like protein [Corynespora cassiicola Philippines]|uniref:Beta-lactamase/transpeptidase-like protein n=1 Tax=Corynespora cassiicola Philippines TaxID=1448308 RepID=A0A2T2NEQ9_CORCC|nr:beta-lactamase/transpeptidase-like protein [Corynespora cassiicola Philippines]